VPILSDKHEHSCSTVKPVIFWLLVTLDIALVSFVIYKLAELLVSVSHFSQ
jgi:hypothetical protein